MTFRGGGDSSLEGRRNAKKGISLYRCDTCDRTMQIQRKPDGIETVGSCIITQNCRGKLHVEDIIMTTSNILQRPVSVAGLTDHSQRKRLFKFTQAFDTSVWIINHNLETFPIIAVYGNDANQTQIPETNYFVAIINQNTVEVRFDFATSGTAELYVREVSVNNRLEENIEPIDNFFPVSTNLTTGTMTIALTQNVIDQLTDIDTGHESVFLKFTNSNGGVQAPRFQLESLNTNTPWNGTSSVIFRNRKFNLRTINIFTNGYNPSLVSDGTRLEILKSNNEMFNPLEGILLLANDPFDNIDILNDSLIELDRIDGVSNILVFDNDGVVCNNSAISKIFPKLIIK